MELIFMQINKKYQIITIFDYLKSMEREFTQYRTPVFVGPSSKT
jgi:hypothetical protein